MAGKVEGVRAQDGQVFLELEACGTEDEGLLKAITSKEGRRVSVHVCPPGCGDILTDEHLVHGRDYEVIDPKGKPWFTNLVQVAPHQGAEFDEMAAMREDAAEEACA